MQKLGRNKGAYFGDTIDIDQTLATIAEQAFSNGWTEEVFCRQPRYTLKGYSRLSPGASRNIYLSSGIHGDEPSGPLALAELFKNDAWPSQANFYICPCLNPTGFKLGQRENEHQLDLNRDYRHLQSVEIQHHVGWLRKLPLFDVAIFLHEDWEANGFYFYELNPHRLPSFAEPMIKAVSPVCPIETEALVDGVWECRNGVIQPLVIPEERPQWAEAIFMISEKSRLNYTLETPSDFSIATRVNAHVAAVQALFQNL